VRYTIAALLAAALGATSGLGYRLLASTGATDPSTTLLTAGISALVAALGTILSGKVVVPTFAYTREKVSADKWQAEAMRLNAMIQDRYLPAIEASTLALNKSSDALVDATAALQNRRRP
jgi:hypothetical protein